MALELNGTTGVSLVQDGVVTAADLASGAITSGALPAGSVLQVVEGTATSTVTVTTTTLTDTGLSATITPSSASSKILILMALHVEIYRSGDSNAGKFEIRRNGSSILGYSTLTPKIEANGSSFVKHTTLLHAQKLDSPSATSAVTYSVFAAPEVSSLSGVAVYQKNSLPSYITLMEIAG